MRQYERVCAGAMTAANAIRRRLAAQRTFVASDTNTLDVILPNYCTLMHNTHPDT